MQSSHAQEDRKIIRDIRYIILFVVPVLFMGCSSPTTVNQLGVVLPDNETELHDFAVERCLSRQKDIQQAPDKKYVNDICVEWKNLGKRKCCIIRDIDYWCGGSSKEKHNADISLLKCMRKYASDKSPEPGSSDTLLPVRSQWGYGWD